MPKIRLNDADIYFEENGAGEETIVFSHGLLWNVRQWHAQREHFASRYRCIAYDHRGQGKSEVPDAPMVDMETLYDDAAALIEALDAGPCHFVGLSMGGFVGLRLAARRPDLVRSLCLLNTSASPEDRSFMRSYRKLTFVARLFGVQVVTDRVMPLMFGPTFLNDPSRTDERDGWREELMDNARSIHKAVKGVIYRPGVEREAGRIDAPTLVIHGDEDAAISRSHSERLERLIPRAELLTLERCGHMSSIEQPDQLNTAIDDFLGGLSA